MIKRIEWTFGELTFQARIERVGQQPPRWGDDVIVRVHVDLPTEMLMDSPPLHPAVQFGYRQHVDQANLTPEWGRAVRIGETWWRTSGTEYVAATWARAERQAEIHAQEQIQQLLDALTKRAAALVAAELPEEEEKKE